LGADLLAGFEGTETELQIELVGRNTWETFVDHFSVGEEDAVEGKTGSLDWVLVHFSFINNKFTSD
jgi:hypothetical protein